MQYDRETRFTFLNTGQNIKPQLRQCPVRIRLHLDETVAGTDGNRQTVAARALYKIDSHFRVRIHAFTGTLRSLFFLALQYAKFCLHRHLPGMSILSNFSGQSDVLLKRQLASVDHNR